MPLASLRVGAPAWRAGRAVAAWEAVIRAQAPADDALDALAEVGTPDSGWWEVLGHVRKSSAIGLLLPRPGDPRGIALPRGIVAEAAVGWGDTSASTWLLPTSDGSWDLVDLPGQGLPTRDVDEAHRRLRSAVVDMAHVADGLDAPGHGAIPAARESLELTVDAWVLGPLRLPGRRRQLASMGLRMLLALEGARTIADSSPLEDAARTAIEAAFSLTRAPG